MNPAIEVLPWEYNVDFRPAMVEMKKFATAQFPVESNPAVDV